MTPHSCFRSTLTSSTLEFLELALFNHVHGLHRPRDRPRPPTWFPSASTSITTTPAASPAASALAYENHALYADTMYSSTPDQLWINLYAPSTVRWADAGISVEMTTDFPLGNTATLTVTQNLRQPHHRFPSPRLGRQRLLHQYQRRNILGGSFLCPAPSSISSAPGPKADTVTLTLPKVLAEPLPDNPNRMALLYGPLVLARRSWPRLRPRRRQWRSWPRCPAHPRQPRLRLCRQIPRRLNPSPTNPTPSRPPPPTAKPSLFVPFFTLTDRRYGIYWDVFTPQRAPPTDTCLSRQVTVRLRSLDFRNVANAGCE